MLAQVPKTITGPAMMNILAAVPVMKPSLLNSRAGETTALAKPVIGTSVPAPPSLAASSYTPRPVKSAPRNTRLMEQAVPASAEEATRRRAARLEELRDQAAGIRDAWPCLTQEERQTVIRDCVDRIVVNGPKVEIYYTFLQQDPKA